MGWEPLTDADLKAPERADALAKMLRESNAAHIAMRGNNKAEDGWRVIINVFRDGDRIYVTEDIWHKDDGPHHAVARKTLEEP